MNPLPRGDVWEKVCADRSNCRGSRCLHYRKCFFQRARRRLREAQIIVANHSLFFSDLVLHAKKGGFLPQYDAVIFDEAHSVESVACEHFGLDVSNYSVRYLLNSLYNAKTGKGFLTVIPDNELRKKVEGLYRYADGFFSDVADWLDTRAPSNGRVDKPMDVIDTLSAPLKDLAKALRDARDSAESEDDEMELASYSDKCIDLAFAVNGFLTQQAEDFAWWVERSTPPRRPHQSQGRAHRRRQIHARVPLRPARLRRLHLGDHRRRRRRYVRLPPQAPRHRRGRHAPRREPV